MIGGTGGQHPHQEPVFRLSPPLIAGPEQFDEIVTAMRVALVDAMGEFGHE